MKKLLKWIWKLIALPFLATYASLKRKRQKIAYFFEVKYQKDTTYILLILIIFIFGTSFLMWRDCLAYESKSETSFKVNTERIERRTNKYSARVINQSEEDRTTPEQQYIKAYREDTGFKSYIDNMKVANNNPGNLEYAGQPNSVEDGRFAKFNTPYNGFRALIMQINADLLRGDTLEKFISEYAPPEDNNDTEAYTQACESKVGSRKQLLKDLDVLALAVEIVNQEHSYKFN